MGLSEDAILQFFSQYTYEPFLVYGAVILLMLASAFGFPAPEEITLISAGLVCYMGTRPDLFPPPYEGATPVNMYVMAVVCFLAVLGSDTLVYSLGKKYGTRILRAKRFRRFRARVFGISRWTRRYGSWAVATFRFTPGIRFPGHLACGMLGISRLRFMTIDSIAAALTVPTQVLLVGFFGEHILIYFKQVKIVIALFLGFALIYYLFKKLRTKPVVEPSLPLV
jgi:membrane protein DedA with SNARE-associated domain